MSVGIQQLDHVVDVVDVLMANGYSFSFKAPAPGERGEFHTTVDIYQHKEDPVALRALFDEWRERIDYYVEELCQPKLETVKPGSFLELEIADRAD